MFKLSWCLLILSLVALPAQAQFLYQNSPPLVLHVQILDDNGEPWNSGFFDVKLNFYDEETSPDFHAFEVVVTSRVARNGQVRIPVDVASLQPSDTPFINSVEELFAKANVTVGVIFLGGPDTFPTAITPNEEGRYRIRLASASHAQHAANAGKLDGRDADVFDQSGHSADTQNPHHTNWAQVGAVSQSDFDFQIGQKADLDHGHDVYSRSEVDALLQPLLDRIVALEAQAGGDSNAELAQLLTVIEFEGDTLQFSGVNVQILNGVGVTNPGEGAMNGLGNLIVGYNIETSSRDRQGTHNLIIGDDNSWTGSGGIVTGFNNQISGGSVILGRNGNVANDSTIISSLGSQATQGVVIGGTNHTADDGVIVGGSTNVVSGNESVVIGGTNNQALGQWAVVSGGENNEAEARQSTVFGGRSNRTTALHAAILGGDHNLASGDRATIYGGADQEVADENGRSELLANIASLDGNDLIFDGVNVHIQNGSGNTGTPNGLGNLVIGYNELPVFETVDRSGSHNLVLGRANGYQSAGGIVNGTNNNLSSGNSAIIGGAYNTTYAPRSVVIGGSDNEAGDPNPIPPDPGDGSTQTGPIPPGSPVVIGGLGNEAVADGTTVIGGVENATEREYSTLSGGQFRRVQ